MFKDEKYSAVLESGSFKGSAKGNDTIQIGFSLDVPVADYRKLDAGLGRAIMSLETSTDNKFKKIDLKIDFPPMKIDFAPRKGDLTKAPNRHKTELGDVQIHDKAAIVKRLDTSDKKKTGTKLVLLLSASLTKNERSTNFVKNYFNIPAWCHLQLTQREMKIKTSQKNTSQGNLGLDAKKKTVRRRGMIKT